MAFRFLLTCTMLCALGCTTSLATLIPASTTPKGSVRVSAGAGGNIPAGQIVDLVTNGQALLDDANQNGNPPSEEEQEQIENLAISLLTTPPSIGIDAQLRLGVADNLDIGARFSSGAVGGDLRWQFLGGDDGFAGSIGLGARFFLVQADEWPVGKEYQENIEIRDLKRVEVDVPILFGISGSLGHLWFGPKFAYSRYSNSIDLTLNGRTSNISLEGSNFYYGAQLGFAVGFEVFWLGFELTVAGVSVNADATVGGEIREVVTDGLIIYPAGTLLFEF